MTNKRLRHICTGSHEQVEDSGGDPRFIPELTYEQFLDFHKKYYHPSNCQVFLYGNLDVSDQLEFLDRKFFSQFEPIPPSQIPVPQKPWGSPKTVTIPFPAEEGDVGSTLALNWLCVGPQNPREYFLLDLLSDLLLGEGGLVSKLLLDSGLGEDISPVSGFETEVLQGNFTIGLRGASPGDMPQFRDLVLGELEKLATQGIPPDLLESTLAAYEFSLKEIRGAGREGKNRSDGHPPRNQDSG